MNRTAVAVHVKLCSQLMKLLVKHSLGAAIARFDGFRAVGEGRVLMPLK